MKRLTLWCVVLCLLATCALPVGVGAEDIYLLPYLHYYTEIEKHDGELLIWWEDPQRPDAAEVRARMDALGWTDGYQGNCESINCGAPQGDYTYFWSDGQGEAPP